MVDVVGRISAVHRSHVPFVAGKRHGSPANGLRGDGALAHLDCGLDDGSGDLFAPSAIQRDCQRHLSKLLSRIDDQPEHLAARLLYRFGSIARISQASEIELRRAADEGEKWVEAIIVGRQLVEDGLRESLLRTNLHHSQSELRSYLLATMQHLTDERMVAIFADSAGQIIAEEIVAYGAEDHVLVTPRKLFGRALNLDARRIVLAHNHPSGSSNPSKHDIAQTQLLIKQAAGLGMTIEDHLIVGYRRVTSMRESGLL
jgi:DNA repair protein RadC